MGMINVAQKGNRVVVTDYFGRPFEEVPLAERRRCVTGYHLRYVVEGMVRGITAKVIKHYYGGSGAATNDHLMLLPRIPRDWLFTLREQHTILGYTAHEICHQLYTRFAILDQIFPGASEKGFKPTKRQTHLKAYWNAIEDYRIEKVCRRDYPGFPIYINVTRDHSAEKFLERVANGEYTAKRLSNPFFIGAVAMTWVGARLNSYRTDAPERALEAINPMLREWIESWTDDLAEVATNDDSLALAERIVEELYRQRDAQRERDDDEKQPDDQQQPDGQQPQDGQKGSPSDDASDEEPSGQAHEPSREDGTDGDEAERETDDRPDDERTEESGEPEGEKAESGSQGEQEEDTPGPGADDGDDAQDGDAQEEPGSRSAGSEDRDDDREEPSQDQVDDDAGQPTDHPGFEESDRDDGDDEAGMDLDDDVGDDETDGARPPLRIEDGDEDEDPEAADLDIEDVRNSLSQVDPDQEAEDADIVAPSDVGNGIDREKVASDGAARFAEVRAKLGGAAVRSAGIVRRLLQAHNQTRVWRGREEGDLDFERVVGMALGHSTVHKQLSRRISVNTAITLLLDNSGSMTGNPLRVCQETAVTLDLAVAGTRTATEIVGFTSNFITSKVRLYQYRTFEQKGASSTSSLGNMTNVTLGGTPVATPILDALRRMMPRPEERKIVIVVSDGAAEDPEEAARARELAESVGCIVVGISIGSERDHAAMRQWCLRSHGISAIDDLPLALTRIVQEIMR
jgi:hypothetical protein